MKKLACSLLTIIILLTISCEIGLGESVDTDPPSLTIDANIADKIIRDDFALRGVYTDDGSITKLSAILKRTDGTGDPLEFTGVYEEIPKKRGTGTWTIDIPAKTNPIKDGTYQADVSITDGVGRVTTQSTIFTIDNTPPIIILTRPSSSIQSSSSDTYGQKFTIEGAAAETNNIGLMEIQLYSDSSCTQLVTEEPIVLRNVPISIEVEAANYDVEAAKYIYEGVTKQFNIEVPTDGEGQQFYYKLFAYDGAERYLPEDETATDEDSKGNKAECFYLQKDIYEPIGQYYSTTELYAILSGNYTEKSTSRAASAPDITKVKADLLNDTEDGYQRKIGKFILNPKNNPTYTITGRTPLADENSRNSFDSTDNELTNGGQVIIEVSPGLDGHILNEDSIKVYTKRRYFNADGTFKEDGAINYFDNSKLDIKTSGSAYKYITTINREDGFEIGGYYIIGVEGKDVRGNEIVASGTNPYGIKLTSNGRPPAITITEPSEATTYTNKKQIFKGTVEVELGTPTINIYKGSVSDATKITTIDCSASAGEKEGSSYVYNFTYEDASFDETTKNQKFIFEAEVGGSKSAQPERTVVYDMDAPTYVITKPATAKKFTDAIGTEATGAFLNGTVEFSVMLNDKGGSGLDAETNKPVWEVLDASSPTTVLATGVIEETTGENVTIDTTASQFLNKSIIFRVTAWDIAGNKKSSSSEDSKYTFVVDQNTDKPYIAEEQNYKIDFNLNNIDENGNISGDSVDVVERYHNQSAESRKGTVEKASGLKFYVYDDDGTTEVSIRNKKLGSTRAEASATGKWENDVNKLTEVDKYTVDTPNKLVAVSSYTFPPNDSDCGYYEYAVVVTDKNDTTKQTVKGPFLVRITQDRASITVTADKKYSNRNVAFTNIISITPSDGPYKIYRQVVREGEATYADDVYTNTASDTDIGKYKLITSEDGIDELTYSDNTVKIGDYYSSAADDKDITVYYKVLDSLGLWSIQKSVLLKVDNGKPTLVLNTPAAGKKGIDALNATTPFTGTVKDEVNGVKQSGVKQILYKFVPLDAAGNATENPDYEIATFTDGPFALPMKDFIPANQTTETEGKLKEGIWKLYIKAQDEAGNESDVVEREFDIDLDNPILASLITTATIANDAYQCKETGGKYFFNGELKGTASATDTAGAATLLFKIGNTELTSSAVSFNGNNWSIAAANFAEGQQTLTITAKDWVGKTTPVTYTVYKDTTAPQLTADNPGAQSFAPTINGTVSDNSGAGVKQIYWSKTGKDATDFAPVTYKTESGAVGYTTGAPDWKFTVPAFSDSEPEATKTYWFKAEDNLSNKTSDDDSDAIKVSFEYDKAAPTVTLTDESTTAIYKNTNAFTISGTAHDSNKLKSIYIEQNGELIETISTGAVKDYSWSKELSGLTNRRHTFTIYAEDAAGKKSQIHTQEIVVDTSAPTVEITNPANNNSKLTYALRTNTTFTGTVQDNVAGADKVFCLISKSEPENTNSFVEATIANGEWSYTPESLTEDLGYKLYVYAVDKAGNSTATGATPYVIREFDVDNANPTISSVTVDEQYNKASTSPFTVEVVASDTHGIADNGVTVTWGTEASQSAPMTYDTSVTKYKKDFSFGTSGALLPDGNYTFTITAKDKANKEVTTTKSLMIDTNAPSIAPLKISGTSVINNQYYASKTLAVTVDVVDIVSGVQKVEYTLDDGNTWTEIFKQGLTGNTYGGTVNFAGGENTIKVRAVDKANNMNDLWEPVTVKIDDSEAELASMFSKVGNNPVSEIASTVYIKRENAVTGTLTLYGKYYDGESGLKEGLTFEIDDEQQSFTVEGTSLQYYTPDESTPANPTATQIEGFTYGDFAPGAKYWKAVFIPSKEGTLKISGKNNANKASEETSSKIKIDDKKPSILNVELTDSFKKDENTFFVNNTGKTFTLEGGASDNYGLVDILLNIKSGSMEINPDRVGNDVSDWSFGPFDISDNSWGASATATLTLKDIAGHITTKAITINFDTTPPVKVVELDAKNKDLYFRIGKADNDDNKNVTTEGSVGKWNDTLDKDVGKKYENNSFGNDNTILLRGLFSDGTGGSGIKMIYYKIYDTWDNADGTTRVNLSEAELNNLITDVCVTGNNGEVKSVAPVEEETRRVFYNVTHNGNIEIGATENEGTKFKNIDDNYDQYFKNVKTNFKASIAGFKEGTNYLVLVAEDNVGNRQVVETEVGGTRYSNFKVNVDTVVPEIKATKTDTINTKSSQPVTITGFVEDEHSGINDKSFAITIDNHSTYSIGGVDKPVATNVTLTEVANSNKKQYNWTATIPAEILSAVGKSSFSVMAEVKDSAGTGNPKTDVIANIAIDDTAPTLKFDSTSGYNKGSAIYIKDSISAIVSATDKNGIAEATASTGGKVYYNLQKQTDSSYVNIWSTDKSIDISTENSTGEITISSTDLPSGTTFENGKSYKLVISTKDTVGNESTEEKVFTVDATMPNSTELTLESKTSTELTSETKPWFSKNTLKLTGKFTDAASGVKTVYYRRWLSTGTEPSTAVEISPEFVNENGGYYKYETNIGGFEKGTNKLKVWAKDNVGNEVTPVTYDVQLDEDPPEISEKNANDFDTEYMTNGVTPKQFEFNVKEVHSGISVNDFIVKVGSGTSPLTIGSGDLWTDTDETNLLALKAKGTLTTEEQTTKNALEAKSALNLVKVGSKIGDNYPVTVQIGTSAVSELNGNKPVTVTVQDVAGNKSSTTPVGSLNVDTTKPVVKFSKPSANAKLNKNYKVSGSITEKNEIKSITLTATTGTGSSAKTNTYSYKKTPAQGETNTITLNEDKSWEITVNTNTAEWNNSTASEDWTLTVSVVDEAGNVSDDSTRSVKVDQNSDRPIIKVSQIDSTGSGFVTVKTLFGTIDDDDKTDNATVNKLWLWSKQGAGLAPSTAPSLSGSTWTVPEGWMEFGGNTKSTLDNNSWQLDSDEDDGDTTWFWAVADTNNNVFWTKAENQLNRPYIIYKGETDVSDNTNGISFKYDTKAPEITKIELMRLATNTYKPGTTRYSASEISGYITDYNDGKQEKDKLKWVTEDNYVFGADYALMYMKVSVKEETGMATYDASEQIYPLTISGIIEKAAGNTSKIEVGESSFSDSFDSATNVYTYLVGPIDFTTYPMDETSETYPKVNITITARDGAGKTSLKDKAVYVDNVANITVTKVSPDTTKETSGEFEFRVNLKDRESDVKNIQYYIPLSTENNKTSVSALASDKWNDVTELTLDGCVIEFTDFNSIMDYSIDTTTNQPKVKTGFEAYEIKSNNEGQGIYNVPVWFKVTDEVGNIGYANQYVTKDASGNVSAPKDIVVKYNPNTDRPKVYITDPVISANPVEKGGKIKISGTAEDNEGIAAVYLQFDMGTGTFAEGSETVPTTTIKATKANNTKNWNCTLDVGSIANDKIVRVRAIAVDTDTSGQLVSAWSDVLSIKVNNTVPSFENMYLRQYDTDGTTVKVEKEYQLGMFVKGEWILEGTVSTVKSDNLNQLSIGGKDWLRSGSGTGSWGSSGPYDGVTVSFVPDTSDKTIRFSIPVSGTSGEWSVGIDAYDNANNHNTETPAIYIDEKAPEFADYVGEKTDEVIKLYQDSYGGSGRELGDANFLKNSNGSKFTLAGKVKEPEGESGFEKAVFYFERFTGSGSSKSNPRVYNVMESRGQNNNANKTLVAASKAAINETHPIYINSDKLPVRPITVTRPGSGELSAEVIKTDKNIRNYGLVYVGGLYRTITSINRTTGVVTIDPADETNATAAEFVYGMVVDNNGEGENSDGSVRNDDGDGMLESWSGSQSAGYRWEATFNSANIPDGPIEIHVVVFDQAGNIGHGYMTTRASNNAPRITKVMLGTDLNGNGVFDYGSGEFNTFYAQKDDNQNPITKTGLANWNLITNEHLGNSKSWKVKNGIAVIPEFVGGAPDFYYQFSKAATSLDEPEQIASADLNSHKLLGSGANDKIKLSGTETEATWDYSTNKVDGVDVTNYGGSLTLTTEQINAATGSVTEDTEGYYRFTFWDSTEESTPGTDTGSTILNIQLIQDLTDDIAPTAEIEPFKWEGTGYTRQVSTSVNGGAATTTAAVLETLEKGQDQYYVLGTETVTTSTTDENGNVSTTVTTTTVTPKNSLYGASKANGHIELQEDIKNITAITSTLGADDPKVSGKITFHGTAFDETRLSSIWFKFDDFTPTDTLEGGDSSKTPATGYSQAAYYNKASASWTLASATIADGWEISVTDKEFSQDGHTVDWYLSIDTSMISNVAGKDKAFTIVAMDAAGKKSTIYASGSEDQTKVDDNGTLHKTPYYKVDVVPYITGIETSLDEAYSSDPTAFSRSALGGYPVLRGETGIEVSGFNLKSGTTTPTVSKGSVTDSSATGLTITIQDTDTTGDFDVTVNGIQSLNNLNKVDVEYNKEPNSSNNRILNNRRKFYVWGNSHKTVDTTLDSTIRYTTFRVGPNGEEVFSFDLGGDSTYLYKDGTPFKVGRSFTQWYDTAVSIDNEGNLYGVAMNGDNASQNIDYNGNARFHFYPLVTSNLSAWTYSLDNGAYAWENASNGTRYNPNRIQNPKLVSTYNNGVSSIYSVYFDATEKLVKFRAGTYSEIYTRGTTNVQFSNYSTEDKDFRTNSKGNTGNYVLINGKYYALKSTGTSNNYEWYSIEGYSGTANFSSYIYTKTTSVSDSISNFSNGTGGSTKDYQTIVSGNSASAYSALAVASNGTAIVCWYDSVAKSLKLKYNTSPLTSDTWSPAITIDSGLAGWYPDMVLDKDGGIHIAYYGAKNGDLKYAYLTSYTDGTADVCTVDSFLSVGTKASISVSTKKESFTVNGTSVEKYVPFISYYMSSFTATQTSVRTAWPVALGTNGNSAGTNTYTDGVESDMFTGSWEVQTLPLDSFPTDYTIGIGVKNTSTTDANAAKAEENIILGYGTTEGLETARLY